MFIILKIKKLLDNFNVLCFGILIKILLKKIGDLQLQFWLKIKLSICWI